MSKSPGIKEQLRRNAVALISLAIAITSLGYNTWRNEASEHNRNQRLVSIEILVLLGELQKVVLDRRWGKEANAISNHTSGWALSLTIRDIAMVAAGKVPESADRLHEIWRVESESLGSSNEAQKKIEAAINEVRRDTHDVLESLD